MELLLFGGTGEGRALAEWHRDEGIPVTVCVATAYGSTLLPPGVEAHTGRLDRAGMEALMVRRPYTCVIDATHPYAVEVPRPPPGLSGRLELPGDLHRIGDRKSGV